MRIYWRCANPGSTYIVLRDMVYAKYEDKRKSQCTAPDKMLLFHVKIIFLASSVAALGLLKKEVRFSTDVDLQL